MVSAPPAAAQAPTPTPPSVEDPGAPTPPAGGGFICMPPACRVVCTEPTPTWTPIWRPGTPVPTWTPSFTSTATPVPTLTPAFTPTPTPEPSGEYVLRIITTTNVYGGEVWASAGEYMLEYLTSTLEIWGTWGGYHIPGQGAANVVNIYIDIDSWNSPNVADINLGLVVGLGFWEAEDLGCLSSNIAGGGYAGWNPSLVRSGDGGGRFWDSPISSCPRQWRVFRYYFSNIQGTGGHGRMGRIEIQISSARMIGWYYICLNCSSTPPPTPAPSLSPTPTPTPTPDPAAPAWRVRFEAPAGAGCRLGSLPIPCSADWMAVSPGVVSLSFSGSGAGAIWVENGSAVGKTVGLRASLAGVPAEVCTPAGCYPANSFSSSTTVPAGNQVRAIYISQGGATGEEQANAFVDLSGGGEHNGGTPAPTPTPIGGLPPGCRYEFAPPSVTPIPSISCLWFPPSVDLSWLGIGRTPALRICFQRYVLSVPLLDFMLSQIGLGGVTLSFQSFVTALTIATAFYALIRLVRRG